jgi:hypothetical protein
MVELDLNCYLDEKDLKKDIKTCSFQIEGFNGWLFAPIVVNEFELGQIIKFMKSMDLIINKVEKLKLGENDELTYYIWFYKKNQLKRVK